MIRGIDWGDTCVDACVDACYIEELRDTEGGCEGSMIKSKCNGNLYHSGVTPTAKTNTRELEGYGYC